MNYKKIISVILLVLISAYIYQVVQLNQNYPNASIKKYKPGDTVIYHGLEVTLESAKILKRSEFLDTYPKIEEQYEDISQGDEEFYKFLLKEFIQGEADTQYISCEIKISNPTDEEIDLQKHDSLRLWKMDLKVIDNNPSLELIHALNDGSVDSYKPGEEKEIIVPFEIPKGYLKQDDIKKYGAKIIYSLYPTKNYYQLNFK